MKKSIVPLILVAALAACGSSDASDSTEASNDSATTQAADAGSDASEETVEVAPPTTEAGVTSDTAEPETSEAETADTEASDEGATDTASSDLQVLTVEGVGVEMTDSRLMEWGDQAGIDPNSAVAYETYGGQTDIPFVDLPNARLLEVDMRTGDTLRTSNYHYVVQIAEGTTPDELLAPIVEALTGAMSDATANDYSATEDGLSYAGAEIESGDGSLTIDVTAYTTDEFPNEGQVSFEATTTPDSTPVIPAAIADMYQPIMEQIGVSGDPAVVSATKGINIAGSVSDYSSVEWVYEGEPQAEWDRIAAILTDWEQEESVIPDELPSFKNGDATVTVNKALIDSEPNTVEIGFNS